MGKEKFEAAFVFGGKDDDRWFWNIFNNIGLFSSHKNAGEEAFEEKGGQPAGGGGEETEIVVMRIFQQAVDPAANRGCNRINAGVFLIVHDFGLLGSKGVEVDGILEK